MTTTTEARVAEAFERDITEHVMIVRHEDGLYRHLRFTKPESSTYWFDLVTWPGALAFRGDMGGYLFARTEDMFGFFRSNGNNHGINPGYWAEKLPDGGRSVQEYSEDALRANLNEALGGYQQDFPDRLARYEAEIAPFNAKPQAERWPWVNVREPVKPKSAVEVRKVIEEYDEDGELSHEDGARRLLRDLESDDVVSDTSEWSLREYSYHYLWCCHAIVWGIGVYDASRKVEPATAKAEVAA